MAETSDKPKAMRLRISSEMRVRLWVDVFKEVAVAAVPITSSADEAVAYGLAAANEALGTIELFPENG